ncbi:MAG TPA: AI-2E family transporter [Panacibacter sp.]|nr:AI-2E family transporter [Panacibacter sp.]HNP43116.1 AI-2E family transporter [Panacibacter sp.]
MTYDAGLHNRKLIASSNFPQLLLTFAVACFLLYEGRSIFIPLSFGLLISFVLYPICKWLEKKGVPRSPAILISLSMLLLLFAGIAVLVVSQFTSFTKEWPAISDRLQVAFVNLGDYLYNSWNITRQTQQDWLQQIFKNSSGYFFQLLKDFLTTSIISSVFFLLVPVYAFLILYYRRRFITVLEKMFPKINVREILQLSIVSYFHFIKGMALVYLVVGVLNSIGLLLLGIPHAILFGFLASILTFIPYVGIISASLLPITISWITYNSILYPLGVIAVFAFVQYLEANLIFPWAVSQQLQLNTLMLIIVIFAGGIVWGSAGLILFIPFAAILKLVADHTPGMELVADILGIDEKPEKKK